MMNLKPIFMASALMLSASNFLSAKAKIPIGEREVLNKVYDLPNTDEFKLENGDYLDLATLHKEFNIAYILPLYIMEEPKLVGYDEKTDEFYNMPDKEMDAILASQKLEKNDLNKLPFYTRYGGKLVALLLIAFIIWGAIPSKKKRVEPTNV
ncbi:hypothetical protein ACFOWU_03770 [Epilithonimonas zeae]|uniref:Cytochrome C n=1 Tax=Epilithonimonas zeae TaxID=1416779 RepID=A0A1N6ERG8_9FLAO|nr:hypothetical protein [Epilithonimonas zeae]SIN85531.1 hypothetical protein SAMN05444409_0799 [Epilithonimonas zeae]